MKLLNRKSSCLTLLRTHPRRSANGQEKSYEEETREDSEEESGEEGQKSKEEVKKIGLLP